MNKRKFFNKAILFTVGAIGVYFSSFFVLSSVNLGDVSLLNRLNIYNTRTKPGGHGQTLLRFRDIENFGKVDILFIGSSHTYRGFDPRIFDEKGIVSFNMGTHSQTPLNSYYLLKHYLFKTKPKLVVIESYPAILTIDGFECFQDLVINTPLSFELLEMAVALKSLDAIKLLIEKYFHDLRIPLDNYQQRKIADENYITGGYCETNVTRLKDQGDPVEDHVKPLSRQLDYMDKIIRLNKSRDVETLIVIHPLPSDVLKKTIGYQEVTAEIHKVAAKENVGFVDFNKFMKLDPYDDFKDNHHLNANGVQKFNNELLIYLIENVRYRNLFNNINYSLGS